MSYPRLQHFVAAATAPLQKQHPKEALAVFPMPQASDRIVLFSPHPDDETIFAGGFLASASAVGATIQIILVTDGGRRGLAAERLLEFKAALDGLGIKPEQVVRYELSDGGLAKSSTRLAVLIQKTLSEFRPTLVIAPHPADNHLDHRVLGNAVQAKAGSFTLAQYLGHYPPLYPWPRRHLPTAALLPPKNLSQEPWQSFVLSPELQEKKRLALQCYQVELHTPVLRSLLLAFDRTNELFVVHPSNEGPVAAE